MVIVANPPEHTIFRSNTLTAVPDGLGPLITLSTSWYRCALVVSVCPRGMILAVWQGVEELSKIGLLYLQHLSIPQ